jgi:uncharacterized membrane protein
MMVLLFLVIYWVRSDGLEVVRDFQEQQREQAKLQREEFRAALDTFRTVISQQQDFERCDMTKMINPQVLHELLEDAGIPIDGACEDGRIDFASSVTAEQRAAAKEILKDLRTKPKPRKGDRKMVRQAFRALSDADAQKLLIELLTERELGEPGWAARRGVEIWLV